MPSLESKPDVEFQLELLRVQLKYQHEVTLYTTLMAIGASFLIFSLTLGFASIISEKPIPPIWWILITAYQLAGAIILFVSGILLMRVVSSEREEIENIRKKFSNW